MSLTNAADADALDQLAAQLNAGAESIESVYAPVRRAFHGSGWEGPDADQFGNEWDGPSRARLTRAATALRDAATILQRNAHEQREASDVAAPSGSGNARFGTAVHQVGADRPADWSYESIGAVQPTGGDLGSFLWSGAQEAPTIGSVIDLGTMGVHQGQSLWSGGEAIYDSFKYGFFSDEATDAWQRANDAQNVANGDALDFGTGLFFKSTGFKMGASTVDYFLGTKTKDWLSPSHWTFDRL